MQQRTQHLTQDNYRNRTNEQKGKQRKPESATEPVRSSETPVLPTADKMASHLRKAMLNNHKKLEPEMA
jgi:hypothetical protein